jgi:glutamine synthetase
VAGGRRSVGPLPSFWQTFEETDQTGVMTVLDSQRDYVLRTVEERGVRLIRLWFTDVLGNLKSFAISPAELENALEDGMTFDGSSIDGFSRIQESDVLAIPDPNTFEVLPWGDPKATEARVFCDIHHLDGTPFQGDPRQVLRRQLEAAHALGYTFFVAPDIEFFYFAPPERGHAPVPLDEGGFFDLTTSDIAGSLRKQTIRTLETMSIPVEYSFHEDAPSQHEIDLRHTDALTMADSIMTFRLVVKEVAASNGVHATFMPKPLEGVQGSGMHTHLSLFKGDDNAFFDQDDPHNLSPVAKSFMAGLLRHAAEITAITNQTVNSYKRLVPGFEAPVHISWARNNRSGLIRVPIPKRGNPSATRIEYRSPDPACNPYLAFAVLLAAGMRGVAEGYELAPEADANLFEMSDVDLTKLGIDQLPQSLSDSLRAMEKSDLVHEALGEHIFEWFLRNKRSEWRAYKTHVSAFEVDRYLRAL